MAEKNAERHVPGAPGALTFIDVLSLLNRRKWIVVAVTLAGSIGVFVYVYGSLLLPPDTAYLKDYFIPEARVIIHENSASGISSLLSSYGLGDLQQTFNLGSAGPKASQLAIAIAKTDTFADRIAGEFDFSSRYLLAGRKYPKTESRRMIKASLRLRYEQESGILTVGYKSADRQLATEIVNYVLTLLEEQLQSISASRNQTQLELIREKRLDVESEIVKIQGEINSLQARYRTFDLAAMAKAFSASLASFRIQFLQKNLEIEAYTRTTGIEDPALRKLRIERDTLKSSIEKMEKGYTEGGIIVPSEKDLVDLAMGYTRLQANLEVQKNILETLVQQHEIVKLEVESVLPIFQVYERATVPESKSGPNRAIVCLVVGGASLLVSIMLAFTVDYCSRAMRNRSNAMKIRGVADAP